MPAKKLADGMTKRGAVYWAWFRHDGKLIRQTLSRDRRVAEEMLAELKLRAYRREEGIIDNEVPLTKLRDAWLAYQDQQRAPTTVKRYRQNLANIFDALPIRRADMLSEGLIYDYRAKRLSDGVSARTINMEVGALKTMLNWAVRGKLIGSHPLGDIKPLPHEPKEGRALSDKEVAAILEASSTHYRMVWYTLFSTGMRFGELASLTFNDIDFELHEIIVRVRKGNKTKRERRIPADDALMAYLVDRRENAPYRVRGKTQGEFTKDRVFTSEANTRLNRQHFYQRFLKTCKRAGIEVKTYDEDGKPVEHVDVHSTRRTFATAAIMDGADPKTVQELLGHRTLDMTMRIYAKVNGTSRRKVIGNLPWTSKLPANAHIIPLTG